MNDQLIGASALPARSVIPLVNSTVYWVLADSLTFGLDVAVRDVAFSVTTVLTTAPVAVFFRIAVDVLTPVTGSLKITVTLRLTTVAPADGVRPVTAGGTVSPTVLKFQVTGASGSPAVSAIHWSDPP